MLGVTGVPRLVKRDFVGDIPDRDGTTPLGVPCPVPVSLAPDVLGPGVLGVEDY